MPDTNLIALAANFATLDLNTVLNGIVLAAAIGGIRRLGTIRDHLAVLNNRLGKMETWREDHERLAETVSQNHRETCQNLQETNRREFSALWGEFRRRKTD